jgi:DNA gyrase subunit B
MRKLIEAGHIYVARPPLFKVTQKKEVRFVQTREEMAKELFARGLKEATLHVLAVERRDKHRELTAIELGDLIPVLDEIEHAVAILERRGHSFAAFVQRQTAAGFPLFHVRLGGKEHFFHTQAEVDAFRAEQSTALDHELVLSDDTMSSGSTPAGAEPAAPIDEKFRFTVDEWHEVKALNRGIARLKAAGFDPADLLPLPRLAGREPAVRFQLAYGETRKDLDSLRQLIAEIRRLGERGLTVTRFKGLGEMDPEELWDTTLNPTVRTLLKVTMNDAINAEKMFRTLMGEDVEGRRNFIFAHQINVNDGEIDYGA